jgi:hypothetical protein
MKQSSISLALTLIALASLLNGGQSVSANSPTQAPLSTVSQSKKADLVEQKSEQHETPLNLSSPSGTPTQTGGSNDQGDSSESPWMIAFTGIAAAATILIAIFTCQLVSATHALKESTDEQVKAARASVKAAEASVAAANAQLEFTKAANEQNSKTAAEHVKATQQSARAAELAHIAQRPYLVVEKATLLGVIKPAETKGLFAVYGSLDLNEQLNDPLAFFPTAIFTFRNYGKGAAIIEELVALVTHVDKPPPEHDFSKCPEILIERPAVGPGDKWDNTRINSLTFFSSQDAVLDIGSGVTTLIVYGRVKYRDVSNTEPDGYYTEFYWTFTPPKPITIDFLTGQTIDQNKSTLRWPHNFSRGPQSRNRSA